ncbi:MAG: translocation/assembly module TamB domain-containing protein [Gemmatimonadaceae bacterium]
MKRRKLVALVSAFTLVAIGFIAIVTIGVGVGTDPGREQIRRFIEQRVSAQVNGTIHIGKVSGGLFTAFVLDSFAIRGPDDSIFVSTGRIKLDYNPRDIADLRIFLRNVEVDHPVVRLRQHREGDWNFQRILKSDDGPSTPGLPGRSFGDYVVLDSVTVRNGTFLLTRPWEPDDTLTGAKRDSAIHRNLTNPDREIRRSAEGLTHTYRWSRAYAFLPRVRLADPDSNRFGQEFVIQNMRVEELEPPFSFRNARGRVRRLGDSIFVDIARFDLPASSGSATGRIWWGSGLPVRLDIDIKADSVALNDVAWVYETLPRTGGGSTRLRIRNNPDNLHDFRYELTEMDVRSTRSRLTGAMTFVVGGPVLEVTDVDLRAEPVNFDLVRTLAGGELPVDMQGDLSGYVRGPGGPLTRFVVEESDLAFRDAHVRGAISRFSGRGVLDILDPEVTEFLGFDVSVASLDLRSVQYLFPGFLVLGGTVAGTARLDSSWMDVRFSNANVTHRNGPGVPSRITGSGRVTYGDDFMTYDLDVNAQPVSLTMLSRAYPLHLRGLMSGPVRASGTTDNLRLTMDLQGAAGRLTYAGTVDAYPLSVAAHGTGRMDTLNLRELIDLEKLPSGWITGTYEIGVRGDTANLATLAGAASLLLERSEIDSIRIFPSTLRARFADGRMYVDTLRMESTAARITASGALGLLGGGSDSLVYEVTADSLGGLRRYLSRFTSTFAQGVAADSLGGSLVLAGTARGSLRSPDVSGTVVGSRVFVRREAGREISGSFALADIFGAPTGTASIRFTSLNIGGIELDSLVASTRLDAGRTGSITLGAVATNGVTLAARADMALGDRENDIVLHELSLATGPSRWTLRGPARIHTRGTGFTIDSLALSNGAGGRLWLAGAVPDVGRARVFFRADSIPLHDVGAVAQTRRALAGFANLSIQGTGTSDAPIMNLQARLNGVQYGGFSMERITGVAEYTNRRAEVSLDLARGGRNVVFARGSLPVDLKYFGAVLLSDSLRGTIRTDSATFDIVEAFIPQLEGATGRIGATVDIRGTWDHPDVAGSIRVEDGEATVTPLGIRMRGINADIALFGHSDSLAIRRLVAWSGAGPADSVSLRGYIAYRDLTNPVFSLRLAARTFHALNRRTLARLDVSTEPDGMLLRGPLRGATLTGGLVVDRGTLFLPDPELARKRRVDLAWQFGDTAESIRQVLPQPSSRLMESLLMDNVRVTLGDEVRLVSDEADIKLVGSLTVQRVRERVSSLSVTALETDSVRYRPLFDGVLRAERGTYNLSLGYAIQREFDVEGGTITFFPVAGLDPVLDISALHTVRTDQSDLRVRVRLTGTIAAPILTLESAESFALGQSDLVSYLIFGQPNFELGRGAQDYVKLAAQTLLPSAAVGAAAVLRGLVGPWADFVQLRPGTANFGSLFEEDYRGDVLKDAFFSSRLAAERQVAHNVYVSASAGICTLRGDPDLNVDLLDGLSGRLEWRLSGDASIRAGKEPSASAMICRAGQSGRVIRTPSQWGLSLFRTWRF